MIIPMFYILSGIINNQSLRDAIFGTYKRSDGLGTVISLVIIFYLASQNPSVDDYINKGFMPLSILAVFYGLLQIFGLDFIDWNNPEKSIQLTLGNPNQAAVLLGFISVFGAYIFYNSKTLNQKSIILVFFVLSFVLGVKTNSFQFFVLSIFGIAMFYILLNLNRIKIIVILTLTLLIMFIVTLNLVKYSFLKFKSQTNFERRLEYWKIGLEIWLDHPLFGVGVDNFSNWAPLYRSMNLIQLDGSHVIPDKSHNIIIDHLANGGVFVAITLTLLMVTVSYYAFRLNFSLIRNDKAVSFISSIWVTYLLQSFINPSHILISVIGFLSAGIIVGQYIKYSPARKVLTFSKDVHFYIRRLISLILIVYLVISLNVISRNNKAREFFYSPLSNSKISLNLIDSWQDPKIIELIGNELLNNFDDCSDIELASNALIAQSVRSHQAWYFKALCSSYAQDYLRALEFLNRALILDPLNTNYLSSKAKLELFLKMIEEANLTIDLIKRIDPNEKEIPNLEQLFSNLAK
jgi:hypothetical protein